MPRKVAKAKPAPILTPQQQMFLSFYYDVDSETFGNAHASAIKAGYSESYARMLTAPAIGNMWIRENNAVKLTEDHITRQVERLARKAMRESDQLRALELLAKFKGMVVDRSENKNLNIEGALADLK